MNNIKNNILKNICYTKLVYGRINKKLNINYSETQIEKFILRILKETDHNSISKIGKNYYILHLKTEIRITINSNTFRVITVDKISR
jgi:hypothetical protein